MYDFVFVEFDKIEFDETYFYTTYFYTTYKLETWQIKLVKQSDEIRDKKRKKYSIKPITLTIRGDKITYK